MFIKQVEWVMSGLNGLTRLTKRVVFKLTINGLAGQVGRPELDMKTLTLCGEELLRVFLCVIKLYCFGLVIMIFLFVKIFSIYIRLSCDPRDLCFIIDTRILKCTRKMKK
jgi:hypothetical protein